MACVRSLSWLLLVGGTLLSDAGLLGAATPTLADIVVVAPAHQVRVSELALRIAGGTIGIAGALGLLWIWTLRRSVRRQTAQVVALLDQARRDQEQLQLTLEVAEAGLWSYNVTTGQCWLNPHLAERLGYSRVERSLTAGAWLALVHPEDQAGMTARLQAHLAGRDASYESEHRVRCRADEWRWVLCRGRVVERDIQGVPIWVAGSLLDITERRAAEDRVRASEQRYRELFDHHPLPSWLYDTETLRFLDVNEAAVRQYGYTRDEFLAMTIQDTRPPEDWALLEEHLRNHAGFHEHCGPWRHRRKDGSLLFAEVSTRDLRTAGQQARLVIAYDVTERLRADQALRESQRLYELALRAGRMGVWDMDIASQRVSRSPEVQALLGFLPGTHQGTVAEWESRLHPEDRDAVLAAVARCSREACDFDMEYRVVWPDGAVRWVAEKGCFRLDKQGLAVGANGVCWDVTERHQGDAERARLEEQLRGAQRMEVVGRLAGGVAHDFNNLLTVIVGHASLLDALVPPGSDLQDSVEHILEAAGGAERLTRQLLAFGRRQVLRPQALDLNANLSGIVAMLRRVLGGHIDLRFEANAATWPAQADPGQVEQAVVNLLMNARDALPDGGTIRVTTANRVVDEAQRQHRFLTAGEYVVLTVSDDGHGMTEEVRARLFEPFFTTKAPGKGTGLGLATVYGIVKQSGGHILVDSEPGCGATFEVYLPRAHGVAAVPAAATATPAARGHRERVLLAEDQDDLRALMGAVLEKAGYAVQVAADGEQALAAYEAERGKVDLLVTDVVMPNLGGLALSRKLRDQSPDLPVLFLSGYVQQAEGLEEALPPDSAFLPKPFPPETLAAKVREVLDGRGVMARSAGAA